jgi:hypothetical protein
MPMYQTIAIFILSLLLTGVIAAFVQPLRESLMRSGAWLTLLAVAGATSAASAFVASTRRAGTGFTTSHGWPKPFYFRYLSETGERSDGWDLVYFTGNLLVFFGALLVLWSIWQLSRR